MPSTRTPRKSTRRSGGQSRQDAIYQKITDRVIEQLRQGVPPWKKPWKLTGSGGFPVNFKSKKPYRGINPVILLSAGRSTPWWGSYNQWAEACGAVKTPDDSRKGWHWANPDGTRWAGLAGQHGEVIIFWKQIFVDTDDINPGTGRPVKKRIPMLVDYTVFNADQVDPAQLPERFRPAEVPEAPTHPEQMRRAQEIHQAYIERAGLNFIEGGDRAYYNLHDDIHVPPLAAYPAGSEAEYWSTTFHEDTHATGHPKRVNRPGIDQFDHFGSQKYSKEELAAEMGAAMLMAVAGIETPATIENSAAYVANWLQKLASEPKWVIQAAAQAQKAVDYILGVTFEEDQPDGE
jgi:antirestriction protein ArdC